MLVNRSGLADILGVSINTVTNYLKEGLPTEKTPLRDGGKTYEIDTAKAIEWLINRKHGRVKDTGAFASAKARHEHASAELKEYDLAEKRGLMVSAEDAAAEVSEVFHLVRVRLRTIPNRLAQVLSVESRPQEIERIIRGEIDSALSELSGYEEQQKPG
jgi:phage terminase Nu1 subunit (DNA packaging protein)